MAKSREKGAKTNACRLLEQAKIPFQVVEYAVDEDDLSGAHAARVLGMPPEKLFKTLVARNEKNQPLVFCIPVLDELDLKKAAKASGSKRVELIHVRELLELTGYIRGGCSPIGMKKAYPTWIDETCALFEEIGVSAGKRGCQLLIAPDALMDYAGMQAADLTK